MNSDRLEFEGLSSTQKSIYVQLNCKMQIGFFFMKTYFFCFLLLLDLVEITYLSNTFHKQWVDNQYKANIEYAKY